MEHVIYEWKVHIATLRSTNNKQRLGCLSLDHKFEAHDAQLSKFCTEILQFVYFSVHLY